RWIQRVFDLGDEIAAAVQRPSEAIDHPPKQPRSDRYGRDPATRDNAIAWRNPARAAQRHGQQRAFVKSDDLERQRSLADAAYQFANLADARPRTAGLDTNGDTPATRRG